MNPSRFHLLVLLILVSTILGCSNDGPIAPGAGDGPPSWAGAVGVVSVVPGDDAVTVFWGQALDYQDPPVEYLVFMDTDDYPWDITPVIRPTNDPYTFTGLANGTTYWFGVRCRDSARPPHVDGNVKVLSSVPPRQGWARSWGGKSHDYMCSVATDRSDSVYAAGYTYSKNVDFDPGPGIDIPPSGEGDMFLSKFDSLGNFLWVLRWQGPGSVAASVALDSDGSIYLTGLFFETLDLDPGPGEVIRTSSGNSDSFLIKLDSSGNLIWARTWGGSRFDDASSVSIDPSGNLIVTGAFMATADFNPDPGVYELTSNGQYDAFMSKFDSSGNFLWARSWGGFMDDVAREADIDRLGNIYVTGDFFRDVDFDPGSGVDLHSSNGQDDAYLSKFDPSGNFFWVDIFGGSGMGIGASVALDSSDNVYLAGSFQYSVDFDPGPGIDLRSPVGGLDAFLLKLDTDGNLLRAVTWGGLGVSPFAIAVDRDNNVFVTGDFQDFVDLDPGPGGVWRESDGLKDGFLSKFDSNCDFLWGLTFGGSDCDLGDSVACDSVGNSYLGGWFLHTADFNPGPQVDNLVSNGSVDAFLARYSPDGDW
jgi:hypothetical protein